jgi:hypothetical protein
MQYLRKLQNCNPAAGKYFTVSIPKELGHIFKTDMAVVEPLPDGRGVAVRPARIEAVV